jgi:hypothetical protein
VIREPSNRHAVDFAVGLLKVGKSPSIQQSSEAIIMRRLTIHFALVTAALLSLPIAAIAEEPWVELVGSKASLDAFTAEGTDWQVVNDVHLDPKNARRFEVEAGKGSVIYNGPTGKTKNIVTKEKYGDVEIHVEFNVPKGSNSGIKFEEFYEIQIADSYGAKVPSASHLGGIYPRSEMLPTYHHIDKGYPPMSVASKPPGEWQALDMIFLAPKFDPTGKKIANAKFVKVAVNGVVVHEKVEVPYPTGDNWHKTEVPKGAILLQADHGAVAFRNIKVRNLAPSSPKS